MNTSATEISRRTVAAVQIKLSDGTATLGHLVFDAKTGDRITGDGTLQHPLRVLPGGEERTIAELRAEVVAYKWAYEYLQDRMSQIGHAGEIEGRIAAAKVETTKTL